MNNLEEKEKHKTYFDFQFFMRELEGINIEKDNSQLLQKERNAEWYMEMGASHASRKEYDQSFRNYEQALAIRNKLALIDPEKFLPHVADTIFVLGVLNNVLDRIGEAVKLYQVVLDIYTELAKNEPDKYRIDVNSITFILNKIKKDLNLIEG